MFYMGIFGLNSKTGDAAVFLSHHSGVSNMHPSQPIELIMHNDDGKLEIKVRFSKKLSVYLPYNKIIGIIKTTQTEIKEKGKSVLGRAALGGVLLGPLGAIIGGVSGTGTKKKTAINYVVVINYKPDLENEDTKVLCFAYMPGNVWGLGKFIKMIKDKAGILEISSNGEEVIL